MAALMQSPSNSDSTVILGGKTLPDITLGSLGSSFRSDEEDEGNVSHNIGNVGPSRRESLALSGYFDCNC